MGDKRTDKRTDEREPVSDGAIRWYPADYDWMDKDEPVYERDFEPGGKFYEKPDGNDKK